MAAEFLREAREARGLSLSDIAAKTRINRVILQHLERGEFQAVPAGLYARAYLKAYATTVGLNPDETVRALDAYLPRAVDSFSTIVQTAVTRQPPAATTSVPSTEIPAKPARVSKLPIVATAPLKMGLGRISFGAGRIRLFLAAMIDAALLTVVDLAVIYLSAVTCGVSMLVMLQEAAPAMAMLCGTVTMAYFSLLGGVAGRTCGAWLMEITIIESPPGPMDLFFVSRRALHCFVREASSLVGLRVWDPMRVTIDATATAAASGPKRRNTATLAPFPDHVRSA